MQYGILTLESTNFIREHEGASQRVKVLKELVYVFMTLPT